MIIKVLRLERRSGKSAMPKGGARRRLPDAGELLELRERRVVLLQALLQGLRSRLRVELLKKLGKSDGDVVQVQISALAVLEEVDELQQGAQAVAPGGPEQRHGIPFGLRDPRAQRRQRLLVGSQRRPDGQGV